MYCTAIADLAALGRRLPDYLRVTCTDRTVLVDVPEAEFRIRITRAGADRIAKFSAIFREDAPAGGTWWAEWTATLPTGALAAEVSEALAAHITRQRRRFTRLLLEATPVSGPGR
ncbi:hypothetical protein [Amycolatopsis sp. NPDC004625]|uniref:hypothetical protein n=1 Tax=Amycolatopsis sp. NPDC004625 TaxID=3154670 RepID=UPI0033BB7E32